MTAPQPKSILKNRPSDPRNTFQKTKADRALETALYHANLIQARKDIESEILSATERLIDLPLSQSPPYTASNPSRADATLFKSLIRHFQPSDYDALIQERNIDGRCGYVLCPNAREDSGPKGMYRLVGVSKDFRVVKKEELEKWCTEGEACARRAMYVKVQLNEVPAWERGSGVGGQVDLLEEPKDDEGGGDTALVEELEKMDIEERRTNDAERLTFERSNGSAMAAGGLGDITIRENNASQPIAAPTLEMDDLDGRLDTMHLSVEDYIPRHGRPGRPRYDMDE